MGTVFKGTSFAAVITALVEVGKSIERVQGLRSADRGSYKRSKLTPSLNILLSSPLFRSVSCLYFKKKKSSKRLRKPGYSEEFQTEET